MSGHRALIVAVCALMPAFALTDALVNLSKGHRKRLAVEWVNRGKGAAARGDFTEAAADYDNALNYRPGDLDIRVMLAEALSQEGRSDDARRQLRALLDERPQDGLINLDLGRLAEKDGDVGAAINYYRAAVRGRWRRDDGQSSKAQTELDALLGRSTGRGR